MQLKNSEVMANLLGGQSGQAKLFVSCNSDKYVIVSKKGTDGYYFDTKSKLWTELAYAQLLNDVVDFLNKCCDEQIEHLRKQTKEDEDFVEINTKKIKRIEKEKSAISKASHGKAVIEFITISFFCDDFMNKIDVAEHILPIKNGKVLDLKTLQIRERISTDYFTYELDMNYTTSTPHAERFFSQLMTDDKSKTKVFQRMLGYSITGNINAKCYFVLIGENGDNGKSAVMRVIQTLFKSLFVAIQKSLLFSENRQKSDLMPYLAVLAGKRIGVYNEPSDKLEMNESMIKAITGGDEVIAKKLYRDPFTFTPVLKMWILSNKPIKFDSCSEPMVKRTHLIPMLSQFVDNPTKKTQYKKDPDFIEDLMTLYKDEVFSFIAQGAFEYYKYKSFGVEQCESLVKYKAEYIENMDSVLSFLKRKCITDVSEKITPSDLFDEFIKYCDKHGETMIGRNAFYERLRNKKVIPFKSNGTWYYHIKINKSKNDDNDDMSHEIQDIKDILYSDSDSDDEFFDVDPQLLKIANLRGCITKLKNKLQEIEDYNDTAKITRDTDSIIFDINMYKNDLRELCKERQVKKVNTFEAMKKDYNMLIDNLKMKRDNHKSQRAELIMIDKNLNFDDTDDTDDTDDSDVEDDIILHSDGENYSFFQ